MVVRSRLRFAGENSFHQRFGAIYGANRNVNFHRTPPPGALGDVDEATARIIFPEHAGKVVGGFLRDAVAMQSCVVIVLSQQNLRLFFGAGDVHLHTVNGEDCLAEKGEFQIGAQAQHPHKPEKNAQRG